MDEGRDLDTLLGYQVQRVNLMLMQEARNAVADFGITPAKATALMLLRDNAGCDQSTLARALSINRASAMKLVNTLAECGYVERRSGRDLRSNALHLTPEGKEALTSIVRALHLSEGNIVAMLSGDERDMLMSLLRKVRSASVDGEG